MGRAARVFFCYAHADEALRDELATHLSPLRRAGVIADWYFREIGGGVEWDEAIKHKLEAAEIVLLLVSPSFMASEYIQHIELKRAMERHREKSARVIPIIVRPTELSFADFKVLQFLPRDGKPVTRWGDRDEAWLDVVRGIRKVVESLPEKAAPPPADAGPAGKTPTSRSLRKVIDALLILDSDLEAFCLDFFPEVKRQFASGMIRTQKITLLLEMADRRKILDALRDSQANFAKAEKHLEYE